MEHGTIQPPATEPLKRVQYTGSDGMAVVGRLLAVTDFAILLKVAGRVDPVACWTGGTFDLLAAT